MSSPPPSSAAPLYVPPLVRGEPLGRAETAPIVPAAAATAATAESRSALQAALVEHTDVGSSSDDRPGRGRSVAILGTRGIPARHGGFETFAERLALYLVERGWRVSVYCQLDGHGPLHETFWRGVRLVQIPVARGGAWGTVLFDWQATRHAARTGATCLTLGYNTAVFNAWLRLRRRPNLINMDGLEWQRAKWSWPARAWLYFNERAGCLVGEHLVADHPQIAAHLGRHVRAAKISMIPYGADRLDSGDPRYLAEWDLVPGQYVLVIARPEPENSLLEIVTAFSQRRRERRLVVLGHYQPEINDYHRRVMAAASAEVLFPGAVYEAPVVAALRWGARLYVHGHQVGGTNPALVEALGAGLPILADDNVFNRWVAGPEAAYFADPQQCDAALTRLLSDDAALARMRQASRQRHAEAFTWPVVLAAYEQLLTRFTPERIAIGSSEA